MMRTDLTDITVIMDRSGSMQACQVEAENGLNRFIKEQQAQPGEALFSLMQFDDQYEVVHQAVPIQNVPKCTLVPRGMTALLDTVGKTINTTGERLAAMPEAERPGLVIVVIITDGMENASQEFKREQIKDMITHQQEKYNWQFTFLGANQDAFAEAGAIGIKATAAADYSVSATAEAFAGTAASVARSRRALQDGEDVALSYTEEERQKMKPS